MRLPPRMSAAQLWWWGVGLLVVGAVVSWVLQKTWYAGPGGDVLLVVSTLVSIAHQLGIGLIVVSLAVAALHRSTADEVHG